VHWHTNQRLVDMLQIKTKQTKKVSLTFAKQMCSWQRDIHKLEEKTPV
jgi:hypothetical protein